MEMRRQQAEIPLLPLAEEFHADLWDFFLCEECGLIFLIISRNAHGP